MKPAICNHVHLACTDLAAMIDFWSKGFGATFEEFRKFGASEGAVLDLQSPTKLYLKQMACDPQDAGAPRAGVDHLGVTIESMEKSLQTLLGLPNVSLAREPFESRGNLCAFVKGPDGVLVEIMQPIHA